jgi:hypothetical protein
MANFIESAIISGRAIVTTLTELPVSLHLNHIQLCQTLALQASETHLDQRLNSS